MSTSGVCNQLLVTSTLIQSLQPHSFRSDNPHEISSIHDDGTVTVYTYRSETCWDEVESRVRDIVYALNEESLKTSTTAHPISSLTN